MANETLQKPSEEASKKDEIKDQKHKKDEKQEDELVRVFVGFANLK